MSGQNSVEHFAARALAMNKPALFHVVGDAAVGRAASRDEMPSVYEVFKSNRGAYSIRKSSQQQFKRVDPTSRVASDPFSQGTGWSTGSQSLEDALDSIREREKLGWPTVVHEVDDVRALGEAYQSIVAGTEDTPHRVTGLRLRTPAAPTQYDGVTAAGKPVYVRYRSGRFRIDIGGMQGSDGETIHSAPIGDNAFDGVLSTDELADVLEDCSDVVLDVNLDSVNDPSMGPQNTDNDEENVTQFQGKPREAALQLYKAAERFEEEAEELYESLEERGTSSDDDVETTRRDEIQSHIWSVTRRMGSNRVQRHLKQLYANHKERVSVANKFGERLQELYGRLLEIEQAADDDDISLDLSSLYDELDSVRAAADDLHTLLL